MAKRTWKDEVIAQQTDRIRELENQINRDELGRRLKGEYHIIKAALAKGDKATANMHLKVISVLDEDGRIPLEADIDPLVRSLEDMDLSIRSFNCLRRVGVQTVEDLTQLTLNDLRHVRNLGGKSQDEVIGKLAQLGLSIRQETAE